MDHCSHGKETGEEVESPLALMLSVSARVVFFEKDLNIAVAVDLIEVWRGSYQLPAALAPCSDRRFSSNIFTPGDPSGRHL